MKSCRRRLSSGSLATVRRPWSISSEIANFETIETPKFAATACLTASVLPNSVAVLPFENLSPEPGDAYFAAGIHEELLSQLAKVEDIRVIARASVLGYEGADRPISEIARELRVEAIMEGSVRYTDERVRVAAQLIDATTEAHIWAEVYERRLEDIFAIQADIAERIAAGVEVEISAAERRNIARQATASPEAYALYLQGLDAYPDNPRVVALLDEAIASDPEFSLAHARKAWAHARSAESVTGFLEDPAERAAQAALAKEAAERALALDPNLGYAHAQLARVHLYEMRWGDSRQAYEDALSLSPNDIGVLNPFALELANAGEEVAANRLIARATALDPNAAQIWYGLVPIALGDWDSAVVALRRITSSGPPQPFAYLELGYAEGARGNRQQALEAIRIAEQLSQQDRRPSWLARIARAYARADSSEHTLRLVNEIRALGEQTYVGATTWYVAHMALGDYEEALRWLHVALDTGDTNSGILQEMRTRNDKVDRIWDHPSFQQARTKMGYTDG